MRQHGFSLIELMIAMLVVSILASIAVPAYSDYVRRGYITEATAAMSDLRVQMEQYYNDNRDYGAGSCGIAPANTDHFNVACAWGATGDSQSYLITATGASGPAVGHVYTINEAGDRATTRFDNKAVAKTCWLVKGSEC